MVWKTREHEHLFRFDSQPIIVYFSHEVNLGVYPFLSLQMMQVMLLYMENVCAASSGFHIQ
jgi:hypothetical protein